MADVINMPKLGFDMAEGTLIRWVKGEGDAVEKGELLAEIETDKATVEVESQYTGIVRKHLVQEGASVPVSQPIAVVGEEGEEIDVEALVGTSDSQDAEKSSSQDAEDSSSQEAKESQAQETQTSRPQDTQTSQPQDVSANGNLPDGVRASPLARRVAEEKGVNIRNVSGSGPRGRIVRKDVESFVEGGAPAEAEGALTGLPALQMPDLGPAPQDERVPLSRLRGAIGRRMVQARTEIPHFYVTHEYDMDRVMDARKQANALLQSSGEKLSVNDFLVKASALALRQFPNLNATLDEDGEAIIRRGQVNIGNAVAVENGLLTVVCRDADRKPIRQISQEVSAMAKRVRSGKVQADDIEGSTFSISNLGMFDTDQFVAIINPPEAAILAVGAAQQVPVVKDGQVTVGWRMRATVSVDHRISDGAEAAQFMQALGRYLENPAALLMG